MPLLTKLTLVHVTDGSPRNLSDALSHGFTDCRSYARQRRLELEEALREASVSPHLVDLGFQDQTAVPNLNRVTLSLAGLFTRQPPDIVLTHAYEGGHPDHDATAFAVRAAADIAGLPAEAVCEFASYHSQFGAFRSGLFLPNGDGREIVYMLTDAELAAKRRLIACFRTQRRVLDPFDLSVERFRPAPRYDFTRPPHTPPLYYERFDWGSDGLQFRRVAARVTEELALRALAS